MYFESKQLIDLCLEEIYKSRKEIWSKMALNILNNIILQFEDTSADSILLIMQFKIS